MFPYAKKYFHNYEKKYTTLHTAFHETEFDQVPGSRNCCSSSNIGEFTQPCSENERIDPTFLGEEWGYDIDSDNSV